MQKIKDYFHRLGLFLSNLYDDVISFSMEHIFEYLHFKFPNVKWLQVVWYFYKDHCPLRAAGLSFYTITYLVSGIFLIIFIAQIVGYDAAKSVIQSIINTIIPSEITPTTQYIVDFTDEVLSNQSYIYIISVIALYNMILILSEIKDNFDEILDHYYTKSGGTFIRNQMIKILSLFGFVIFFNFFISPVVETVSQFSNGYLISKYVLIFLLLALLFNHSSNKIKWSLVFKGSLLSTILLLILEFIFGVITDRHAFFGKTNHTSSLGIIFLFPFWIYLAWNIIFIVLEYIATYTRKNMKKFPIEMEQFLKFSILERLYREKVLSSTFITKKVNIDFRFFQEQIVHYFKKNDFIEYDQKQDNIIGLDNWYDKPILTYFKEQHFLILLNESITSEVLNSLSKEEKDQLTFKDYFELKKIKELPEVEDQRSLWDLIKDKMFN